MREPVASGSTWTSTSTSERRRPRCNRSRSYYPSSSSESPRCSTPVGASRAPERPIAEEEGDDLTRHVCELVRPLLLRYPAYLGVLRAAVGDVSELVPEDPREELRPDPTPMPQVDGTLRALVGWDGDKRPRPHPPDQPQARPVCDVPRGRMDAPGARVGLQVERSHLFYVDPRRDLSPLE